MIPRSLLLALLLVSSVSSGLRAAIVVPGADGSDGVLNITADTVIDLSLAVTAQWDANNSANAGKGLYDAGKWAIVFKYSSVNVSAGATVTFKNHPSRAPVVWLVSGSVNIAGTVSLDGANVAVAPMLAEPGPGGFRGGFGVFSGLAAGSGFGPGAGIGQQGDFFGNGAGYGAAGVQRSSGVAGSVVYGNPSLVPLVGGSGGAGSNNNPRSGSAGGGALLIACVDTITISGTIRSNGGASNSRAGGGSGGAIRLVAKTLAGTGSVLATTGTTSDSFQGGVGRLRVERVTNTATATFTPSPSVLQIADGDTALLWPPSSAPTVQVVSIGGVAAPADPRATFDAAAPDVTLGQVSSTTVVVRTTNVEPASQVRVRGTPRFGANFSEVTATNPVLVSNSPLTYDWTVTLPVSAGYSALQVRVVRP